MSSESRVEVVRLGPVDPLDGSDHLSITMVHGGYPCIVKRDAFVEGDIAAYVPIDMTVPTGVPTFAFLAGKAKADGRYRIRALRLRGTFSMGLLVPTPDGASVGDDVTEALGCQKWEPEIPRSDEDEPDPGFMPIYTDIEGFRRWQHEPGVLDVMYGDNPEPWYATEKIHGANARYCYHGGRLWVGSRTRIKKQAAGSMWWQAAEQNYLEGRLAVHPDIVIFGEVYGQVQDLRYGVGSGVRFAMFDAWDRRRLCYLNPLEIAVLADHSGIPMVPLLPGCYPIRMTKDLWAWANAWSTVYGADHVREGIVIRPALERQHPKLGRVILKLVGENYLTRKEK